jgi:hypothetical protein
VQAVKVAAMLRARMMRWMGSPPAVDELLHKSFEGKSKTTFSREDRDRHGQRES